MKPYKLLIFIIEYVSNCKLNLFLLKNRIFAYKPVYVYISNKANVRINKFLMFNKSFDKKRIYNNKIVGTLYIDEEASLEVEDFTFTPGCQITINRGGKLVLKSGGYMMNESIIDCFNSITIGRNCMISKRVMIRDSNNHNILEPGYSISKPITIGDHVWIGMGAIILSGVTIGSGSIIAAGAVVNKNVPENCLVAGVPAKICKREITWE